MSGRWHLGFLFALAGVACQGSERASAPSPGAGSGSTSGEAVEAGEPGEPEQTGPAAGSVTEETDAAEPLPIAEPAEPPPLEGEGPTGAVGRQARRQAVLDLLGSGEGAAQLKLVATDPGRRFNQDLADEMTPKVRVSGRPSSPSEIVKQGKIKVKGELDAEIIRRIVRSHINELRACYRHELNQKPDLKGSLTIDFIITAEGKVASSVVKKSRLGSAKVESCFAKAHRRWKFPKPTDGGVVTVSHGYQLE